MSFFYREYAVAVPVVVPFDAVTVTLNRYVPPLVTVLEPLVDKKLLVDDVFHG